MEVVAGVLGLALLAALFIGGPIYIVASFIKNPHQSLLASKEEMEERDKMLYRAAALNMLLDGDHHGGHHTNHKS
jgi:hypothetical protein